MIVRYFADIRELTGENERRWSGSTDNLAQLLRDLGGCYGSRFHSRILTDSGLSETIIVLVNGRDIRHLKGLDTPLEPEDTVSIFPMVAGG
jgi:sulfur-carrier protein